MKRRSFLRRSLGAASALTLTPLGMTADSRAVGQELYDLIIVGAGTAGLPAAIFASRRGAKVLLLDADDDIGGTLHLANGQVAAAGTTLQRRKGIEDSPDQHFADAMTLTRGLADAAIVRRAVDEAPATINWLLENGLQPLPDHPVTGDSPGRKAYTVPRYLWAKESGPAILAVIRRELQPELDSGRISLCLRTRVVELTTDERGAVVGVVGADGFAARGRHILLTTGGYAMNPQLFQQLTGVSAYVASSHPRALGDGLMLATAAGGVLRGAELHRAGTGSILTTDQYPAKVYARFETAPQRRLPWEIWVNDRGQRFIREDEPLVYERERALLQQTATRYRIVFDSRILREAPSGLPQWSRETLLEHFARHPMFTSAASIAELARRCAIDIAGLEASVENYNLAVSTGVDALGRQHLPRPIIEPPFYAITHLGHSATSSAGITVDAELRVLDAQAQPIGNLYAAGEALGSGVTLGNAFVPGMMLTPALALGRWLGNTLPL